VFDKSWQNSFEFRPDIIFAHYIESACGVRVQEPERKRMMERKREQEQEKSKREQE